MSTQQTAPGCLFGAALGDALAAPTEFKDIAAIVHRYRPRLMTLGSAWD